MKRFLSETMLDHFVTALMEEEKSDATIRKYSQDLRQFYKFVKEREVDKALVVDFKKNLERIYKDSSVNSKIASLNKFFKINEWYDCLIKGVRTQQKCFRSQNQNLTFDDYKMLLEMAFERDLRTYYMMVTLASTGMRVSELRFLDVRALQEGYLHVTNKGKSRIVILPDYLCGCLKKYCQLQMIDKGIIFRTKTNLPVDRSNFYHSMKKLALCCGIDDQKVYPHNLRHLFAQTYYQKEHDLVHLADILGHASVNTTRIYTAVSFEEEAKKINALGLIR